MTFARLVVPVLVVAVLAEHGPEAAGLAGVCGGVLLWAVRGEP